MYAIRSYYDPRNPQKRLINQVVECLKAGGVIVYPTDTTYGIGCDIFNKKGVKKIYQIKQRDPRKPFSFICADLSDVSNYAQVSNFAFRTLKRNLPGPYTFVLQATRVVPDTLTTKQKTVITSYSIHYTKLYDIRTLCHDLGEALGCGAHMTALRRTRSGCFTERDAVADLANYVERPEDLPLLTVAQCLLREFPSVAVTAPAAARLCNGVPPTMDEITTDCGRPEPGQKVVLLGEGAVLAVARFAPQRELETRGDFELSYNFV